MIFKNREEAGRLLAQSLLHYKNAPKTIVIGLPRGGVVVAAAAAELLGLPLDVVVPRKIGAPGNPELAIGALAGDLALLDEALIQELGASPAYIEKAAAEEKQEAARRLALYRKGKAPQNFRGLTLLVIDDGVATGSTLKASIAYLRKAQAKKIAAAFPVGPADAVEELKRVADEVVCPSVPDSFMAVGQFYEHFPQTTDEEVIALLNRS